MKTSELEKIVNDMKKAGIKPVKKFIAKSGKDYGYVLAFKLNDDEYIIEYGNHIRTLYDLTKDVRDLAYWLEAMGRIDDIVHRANVRGADSIEESTEFDKWPFNILETRYWRNGTETNSLVSDENGDLIEFFSYKEAREWIIKEESKTYYLSHNESRRPTYKII